MEIKISKDDLNFLILEVANNHIYREFVAPNYIVMLIKKHFKELNETTINLLLKSLNNKVFHPKNPNRNLWLEIKRLLIYGGSKK